MKDQNIAELLFVLPMQQLLQCTSGLDSIGGGKGRKHMKHPRPALLQITMAQVKSHRPISIRSHNTRRLQLRM